MATLGGALVWLGWEYLAEADKLGDGVNDFDERLKADDEVARIALAVDHAHKGEDKVGLERLGGCAYKRKPR
jgi:hypothetical protein